MNQLCLCNEGIYNTGLPNCVKTQKAIRKSIFVQLTSNAGVLNSIDPSSTLDSAWITALINNADKSVRFFPTPQMKNVDTPKSDPTYEKFDDESSYFIREGMRGFSGILADCPPIFKRQLESIRCNANTGKYDIDLEGNIIGLTNNVDGKLYPIPVNAQSVVAKVNMATDKTTQQIMFTYEVPTWVNDGDYRMIGADSFVDFSPLSISGLLDVNMTVSAISTTGFTATLTTPSPDLSTPIAVQGLVSANFVGNTGTASKVYNVTDTADIAIVSVTETSAGVYVIVTGAQTSADVMRCKASLAGYDFANLPSVAILIP